MLYPGQTLTAAAVTTRAWVRIGASLLRCKRKEASTRNYGASLLRCRCAATTPRLTLFEAATKCHLILALSLHDHHHRLLRHRLPHLRFRLHRHPRRPRLLPDLTLAMGSGLPPPSARKGDKEEKEENKENYYEDKHDARPGDGAVLRGSFEAQDAESDFHLYAGTSTRGTIRVCPSRSK